jgi:MraZ protein
LVVLPSVLEPCLWVYPARIWNARLGPKLHQVSIADEEIRRAMRTLASASELLPWDAAGRLRIRDGLLEHAGLTGQVVLVGAFERFELWEPGKWKQQHAVDPTGMKQAIHSLGL